MNVIPGAVSLTLDIRSPQDEARDALLQRLLDQAGEIAARRGVGFSHEIFFIPLPPRPAMKLCVRS